MQREHLEQREGHWRAGQIAGFNKVVRGGVIEELKPEQGLDGTPESQA